MANYQVGTLETKIITTANSASISLGKMNNQLDKTRKTIKNVGITSILGKWSYVLNISRYYGRSLANIVQYAMDYVETLNLWQVANRSNIALADEFITKMNKAYGISEQTLMNYQAIFKNMLSALGDISDAVSSTLSMQLTQLAVDFSSLYNVTIERAMTVYQSILSGQVRPVRSISGYDITENTIFDLYKQSGGEKSMRQLSQIEKRLLRIVSVFDQMGATGAIGDMAKTIESAANQARVMQEQLKETLTWTGQIILLWLNNAKVFQYVNAVLMTTKEIIKSIAFDLGYEEQDFLSGLITQAENADEALDEVQGKLLSFDKFEALNSNTSNSFGIDPVVEKLIANINLQMNDFEMQSYKIAKGWLEILGFVQDSESEIWKFVGGTEQLLNKATEIGKAILGWSLLIGLIKQPLSVALLYFGYIYAENEEIRDSLSQSFENLFNSLIVIGNAMLNIFIKISPVLSEIVYIISVVLGYVSDIISLLDELGALEAILWSIVAVLAAILIYQIAIALTNPINLIITLIGLLVIAVSAIVATLIKYWDEFVEWVKGAWDAVVDFFVSTGEKISNFFSDLWKKIANGFADMINNIVNWFVGLVNLFVDGINALLKPINDIVEIFGGSIEIPHWEFEMNWQPYANGGFPEEGQLFVAREAGAEMVGSMGGRTAVANNDQIVEGISQGVYNAVVSANLQNNQQITGNVYIDSSKVGKIVAKPVYNEGVRIGVFKKA